MTTRKRIHVVAGGIALATFAAYLPALGNGFLGWDDAGYVVRNPSVHSLGTGLLAWAFSTFYMNNWHPLTWMSHALDYALWGSWPAGHHLTSIVLHALNAYLVVLVCGMLLKHRREGAAPIDNADAFDETGVLIAAGTTGLLFGLHPLHVESVAWIAERKDLLCGLFFLLSLHAYGRHVRIARAAAAGRIRRPARFLNKGLLLSFSFFLLALLSKPMAVSLPVVLLLLDWYPYGRIRSLRSFFAACLEKTPYVLAAASVSVLTILAQQGSMTTTLALPLGDRILVASKAVTGYLGMMAFPAGLSPFYPYPPLKEIALVKPQYLLSVLALGAITALAARLALRGSRIWLAVWGYYLVTLLPVIGIVQVGDQAMADRYTYLPGLGPFLLLGLAAARVLGYAGSPVRSARPARVVVAVILVLVCSIMVVRTERQITVWKDDLALWSRVIERDPSGMPLAYNNRGIAFKRRGDVNRALEDYNKAIGLGVTDARVFNNRGIALQETGRTEEAIADFSRAVTLDPGYVHAYINRGKAFEEAGLPERALADYSSALALDKSQSDAYNSRGVLLARKGDLEQAIADFTSAIRNDSSSYLALNNRALAYGAAGKAFKAIDDYTAAIALRPDGAQAYHDRGLLYQKEGILELALADFQKACGLGSRAACASLQAMYAGSAGRGGR